MSDGNNRMIESNIARAKTHVENAERYAKLLAQLVVYLRTDHVGMLHGDGEITRYLSYISRCLDNETMQARQQMTIGNAPDELPF